MPSLPQRFTASIIGAAIGDALGMPNEDLTLEERDLYYGGPVEDFRAPHKNAPCGFLKAGQYTDDTQLIVAVAESLAESAGFNPESLKQKLIDWFDKKDDGRYRGEVTKQGIRNLKNGVPWQKAGLDRAGCGSSTRAIPFGLFYHSRIDEGVEKARLASCMTHDNLLAKDGAACVVAIIANLVNGEMPSIEYLREKVVTLEFKSKLDDVDRCLKKAYDVSTAMDILGNSNIVHETTGLAVFIFLSNPSDFKTAVLAGANAVGRSKKGDTDSIACLVGAMSGAYNGMTIIPPKWVKEVEDSKRLREIGLRLFQMVKE